MKVRELFEELKENDFFKEFEKKYTDAYLCSAMFVLSEDGDKADLNFFIPSQKKIASFAVPFCSVKIHDDEILNQVKLGDLNLKIDVMDLKSFVKEKSGVDFSKIIGILHDGVWNLTCLNGMKILRMKANAYTGEVLHEEKGSLNDMIRISKMDKIKK